jgi:hypothetical protein
VISGKDLGGNKIPTGFGERPSEKGSVVTPQPRVVRRRTIRPTWPQRLGGALSSSPLPVGGGRTHAILLRVDFGFLQRREVPAACGLREALDVRGALKPCRILIVLPAARRCGCSQLSKESSRCARPTMSITRFLVDKLRHKL